MKSAGQVLIVALAGVTACAAISGLDKFDLTSSASSGAGDGSAGAGDGSAGAGDGAGDGSAGAGATSASSVSSSQSTTSSISSSSTGGGGGAGGGSGGGGPTSSSSSGGGIQVPCANGQCNEGQICCHYNTPRDDYCDQPGGCAFYEAQMECAGSEDCPGQQACCAQWTDQGQDWLYSTCKPSCGASENPFCGGDPTDCPAGWSCEPNDNLGNGYMWCTPP